MRTRTCKDYVALKGMRCPVCGGKNVNAGELWLDDDITIAYLECWCDDCGAQWDDKYKLVGYKNLCGKVATVSSLMMSRVTRVTTEELKKEYHGN